jgi:hypothetical protein
LRAGVSVLALALSMPAFAVDLAPGNGDPWILDTAGTYTITENDTSSADAWIGLDTPGVTLSLAGDPGTASFSTDGGFSIHLGINSTANGTVVLLSGPDVAHAASLHGGDQIFIGGGSDNNRITVGSNAQVSAYSIVLGVNAGSDGNLLELTTATSSAFLNNNLIVGNNGDNNTVTMQNGASAYVQQQVILGYEAGSDGNSFTLSSGAQLTADTGTAVGYRGSNNSMLIQSGADYTTFTTSLGGLAGADGNSLTVTGAGSTFTGVNINADLSSFNVGGAGDNNSLMVSDGAVFTIGDRLAIGQTNTSGGNTVTVTGAGSELYAGNTRIGANGGPGGNSLVVSDGGYVSIGDIRARSGNSISLASGAIVDANVFTLDAGATLVVDVDAGNAIDVDVTGTATLSGNLDVNWSGGAIANRYNLLTAGTRSGTFATVDTAGFAPGIAVSVDYYATGADLVLVASLAGTTDLADNQRTIADTVSAAFNDGESLAGSLAELFAIDPVDLGGALSSLSGEINAYAATELGWSATEAVLDQLTDPDGCAPQPTGVFCTQAFASGSAAVLAGDPDQGSHDTTQSGVTLGVAATTRVDADTLLGGVVSISQSRAAIDGLGDAEVASVRFGASLTQHWQSAYLALGAMAGAGLGETSRGLALDTTATASGDLAQAYLGFRAELGADLPLNGETALTPFAALSWAGTGTAGYAETVSGGLGDVALVYGDAFRTRSSMDLGVRLASGAADALTIGGSLAYRHVLGADNIVVTEFAGLEGYGFGVTPATQPTDQLLLSADAAMALGTGATLGVKLDAGLAEGYSALAGKVSLNGQW